MTNYFRYIKKHLFEFGICICQIIVLFSLASKIEIQKKNIEQLNKQVIELKECRNGIFKMENDFVDCGVNSDASVVNDTYVKCTCLDNIYDTDDSYSEEK